MLNVAVVGCGTAGPAAALLLARQGHSVEIFERVPELEPVGAGVLIQPTGMTVLDRLGLLGPVKARGVEVHRLVGETVSGRRILDLSYGELDPRLSGLGIHRASLHSELVSALEGCVPLHRDAAITKLASSQSGTVVHTDGGSTFGPYDLVVISDGANSSLRDATGLVTRCKRYPWGALWAITEDPSGEFDYELSQTYRSTVEMIGFLPVGIRGPSDEKKLVSFFWSARESDLPKLHARGLDAWKSDVLDLEPRAKPLLDQITTLDQLAFAAYHDVRLRPLHRESAVVIGDAAHAMSPQLGQGVNMALIDAYALAEEIGDGSDLAQSLARFSERRKEHLRYYQVLTRILTPFFQSSLRVLGPPRDLFSPLVARSKRLNTLMLETLVGAKTGFNREIPAAEVTGYLS